MVVAKFLDRNRLALWAKGLWLRYATLQHLIPSFPWIAPPRPPPWRNPRKGRDQILPAGNLAVHGSLLEIYYPDRNLVEGVRVSFTPKKSVCEFHNPPPPG